MRLYRASPAARAVIVEAEATLPGLSSVMWEGPAERCARPPTQQPALLAVSVRRRIAAWREAGGPGDHPCRRAQPRRVQRARGGRQPDARRRAEVGARRGEAMQRAVPAGTGAMAAILKTDAAHVERVLAEVAAWSRSPTATVPSRR
jgi:[acyl-carrier-protein] S-malonyltransferase